MKAKTILAFYQQSYFGAPYIIERERAIEQADEWSDRGRSIVILRLAEKQCGSPFDIAQIDVVAERRSDNEAARINYQDDLWFGIIPSRGREHAN